MNKVFLPGQQVKFIKRALVFDKKNATQFYVEAGTKAIVVSDMDVGEIGGCFVELMGIAGKTGIVVETNDENLEIVSA